MNTSKITKLLFASCFSVWLICWTIPPTVAIWHLLEGSYSFSVWFVPLGVMLVREEYLPLALIYDSQPFAFSMPFSQETEEGFFTTFIVQCAGCICAVICYSTTCTFYVAFICYLTSCVEDVKISLEKLDKKVVENLRSKLYEEVALKRLIKELMLFHCGVIE